MGILCHWIEPHLAAFEADALTGWRADMVARHVAVCATCRREWEAQANVAAVLRNAPPAAVEPAADLWARLQPQLEPRSPATPRPRPWLVPAAGAAACALVGVAVAAQSGWWAPQNGPVENAAVTPTQLASAPTPLPAPSAPPAKPFLSAEEVITTVEKDVHGPRGDAPDPFAAKGVDAPAPVRPLPLVAVGPDLRAEMRRGATGRGAGRRMTPVTPENYPVRPLVPPRVSSGNRYPFGGVTSGGLKGATPDRRVGFVVSELSAEMSSAERDPTEAASMADYQRSLFR